MVSPRWSPRPTLRLAIPWLVVAVVGPSLVLSLTGFWALHVQDRLNQQAARQRAAVLLADADDEIQERLRAQRDEATRQSRDLPRALPPGYLQIPGLLQTFVADPAGQLQWPPATVPDPAPAPASSAWRRAQHLEFVLEDLHQARLTYEEIADTDSVATAHALTAAARCAAKLQDHGDAASLRQRLLREVATPPPHLRLGASWELAGYGEAGGQLEMAASTALDALRWMSDRASGAGHAVASHYRHRFDSLWARMDTSALPGHLSREYRSASQLWAKRFAEAEARASLESEALPLLLPAAANVAPGTCRYVPLRAASDWQVWLVVALPGGGAAGGRLDLAGIDSAAIADLGARLDQFGDEAAAVIDTGVVGDGLLARLRLSPPLSFRHLAIQPGDATSVTASWRLRLLRWGIILCIGGVLAGVWSGWRQIRREREEGRLKTDFVSNVSHELKTPLTNIRMFVDMLRLKRYDSPGEADDYLGIVQTESERLGRMVDRLLDVARMDRGERQFDRSATDLAGLVREMVTTLRAELQSAPIPQLDVTLEQNLPAVLFDRDAIAEVVRNLVLNAVRYSPGPARVRVSLRRSPGGVDLAVVDGGLGIPQAELERIFERFYRVDSDLTRDVQGSGLGLSLVRDLVSAHGGRVSVQSHVGQGSTFSVWLPSSGSET